MKKYIIFICNDMRDKKNPQPILQVAKTTFRKYKYGDHLTVKVKEHYETKKGFVLSLTKERILLMVTKIFGNVIYCDIVGA